MPGAAEPGLGLRSGGPRPRIDDGHVEREGAAGHFLADVAEADDAEGLAGEFGQRLLKARQRPVGLDQGRVGRDQLLGEGEHEREGLLRHILLLRAAGADVADRDAPFAGRVQVDVVEAVAGALDELQLWCGGEMGRGHRTQPGDQQMRFAQRRRVLVGRLDDGDPGLAGEQTGQRGTGGPAADMR